MLYYPPSSIAPFPELQHVFAVLDPCCRSLGDSFALDLGSLGKSQEIPTSHVRSGREIHK